jgi:hypothetical protein
LKGSFKIFVFAEMLQSDSGNHGTIVL